MQNADILALADLRLDGRRRNEIRQLKLNLGVVEMADGSAYLEQGLNKILVTIHGPQEPQRRSDQLHNEVGVLSCTILTASFSGTERKRRRAGDRRSNETEQVVKQSFESVVMLDLYPRSEISIVVHILESDGSVICSILNAVTLGMMDAGIALSDMIIGCSVGYLKQNLCQDVTQVEQSSGGAYLPVAIKARSEDVIFMQLDSRLSIDSIEEALRGAIEGCRTIKSILETEMKQAMSVVLERNRGDGL